MKNSTKKAGNGAPRINPEFDRALAQVAKLPPKTSDAIAADDKAWDASAVRLTEEWARQVDENARLAMTVSPRVNAEVWRHAAYVSTREGVSFEEAVAHLLEEGVRADSEATRVQLRRE
ncbi:MAG: hypothetical protein AB7O66_20315 [Limisphaerales bacterium]